MQTQMKKASASLLAAVPLFGSPCIAACPRAENPAISRMQTQPDAQPTQGNPLLVTADNFICAESDRYFKNVVEDGGFGKVKHSRELTPIDKQLIVRQNRDTLYSAAVFDLDASSATITFLIRNHVSCRCR